MPGDPIWFTVRIGRYGDADFPGAFVHQRRQRVKILLFNPDGGTALRTVEAANVRPRLPAAPPAAGAGHLPDE